MNDSPAPAAPPLDEHTLRVLEFDAVRQLLATHARTAHGRTLAAELTPCTERESIIALQAETTESRTLLDVGLAPSLGGVEDIGAIVDGLPDRRAPLEAEDLCRVAATLECAENVRVFFEEHADLAPRVARVAAAIGDFASCVGEIQRCIDNDNTIRDTASPRLEHLRRSLRAIRSQIDRKLRALMDSPDLQTALDHRTITTRSGRPVIAVKSSARRALRGTMLDKSNTGATVYIEPHAVTELANEYEDARFEEAHEVTRILWALTGMLADRRDEIRTAFDALSYIDLVTARGRYSRMYSMVSPACAEDHTLVLAEARHPLLLHYAAVTHGADHAGRVPAEVFDDVIPVPLRLGSDFDQLIVTGPNTGGKTVALKTVGLLALMAQSGLHVPAAPGTSLPVYRAVFADIGDEQSIAQSLSTFSSHMSTIVRIVESADDATLVLLDELGSGTDPAEGAALATAILGALARSRAHVVATTHLGALKTYAYSTPRVENASMEFDAATLCPTYRLLLGHPGSSNALAIAQRLGMPGTVLDHTRELLEGGVADTEELINKVQETRVAAEKARAEVERRKEELEAHLRKLDRDRAEIEDRAQQFVAHTLKDVRAVVREFCAAARNAPAPWSDRSVELHRRIKEILEGTPLADQQARFIDSVQEGDTVYAAPLQAYGEVRMIRRRRQLMRVAVEGVLYDVPFAQISERPFAAKDPRPTRAAKAAQHVPKPAEPKQDDKPLDSKALQRFLDNLRVGDRVYAPPLQSAGTIKRLSDDLSTVSLLVGVLEVELSTDQIRPCRRKKK